VHYKSAWAGDRRFHALLDLVLSLCLCCLPSFFKTALVIGSLTTNMAPAEPNALPFHLKGREPHFPEELDGWKGYIEWEEYPDKKKEAEAILAQYDFPDVSSTRAGFSRCFHRPRPTENIGADDDDTTAP
jgi:hypothetical protein